ncbi:unnamed protein product [Darwinula stevensoni]|uniref:CDGSH iron-sulfur domain-containing protein 2 homologue n=1 Tax=Darwinula stevensoni TaxID=69355 RepID=A0A7R8XIZ9_9CRUS|nr:unnamed protein product [Darwinula stevensoni]CAG0893909.1 unnamed protein product [Darwinula stevensoni]
MHALAQIVKVSLPNYLSSLPIPDSLGGWFHLSRVFGVAYVIRKNVAPRLCYYARQCQGGPAVKESEWVNKKLKKEVPKVVDSFDIEDVGDKKVFCRCWKSKKFPYCDGSHTGHNTDTGDNVGPLIIKKKDN